ncbi:uncharacterized protein PV06_06217 [Exophiala oligosperma]|uniref:Glycosyl transferase family 25 domain-containing protein n=2 Tax=Chaetothyriales TaxID=34395 RepID=A0A0D2DJT2_9EURO|nr:uncharacterized protein PV06_06217 [Exophiala oligosperma]KAJ9617834.1 hypothetical protein H2204_013417 [Knufia peltigerae]KIW42695.1 hypothetical protein PV06_06217 [Exophiala oligosperma]
MPIVSLRFKYFAFAFLFTIIFLGLWLQPMYLGVVSLSDPANPLTRHVDASRRKFDANPYTNDRSIYRVQNETLGFQEVYMISLPARTDKRDAFALQAAFSGITYTQVDGVDGHDVPEKALPHTMDQSPNAVGCWRAHLNVAQRIVREGVTTAFVFEDDADWDVAFKQQLVQFARGSRVMLQTPDHKNPISPYGDGWDILWIGHCGTWVLPEKRRRFFVIPNDPTVEPPQHRQNVDVPDMSRWEGPGSDNRTRIVFKAKGGVCTAGYAISQQGARKVLYHLSMVPYNKPVDWGLANLCETKQYNFRCISVFPQLVGVSRPQGNTSKWSDIGYGADSERKVENANSQHLVYSTRLNMENLLAGRTIFDSQYPDSTPARMDIKKIGAAVGHVEIVNVED